MTITRTPVNEIRFKYHMFDAYRGNDVNQQTLIRKYSHKRRLSKKPARSKNPKKRG